MQEFKQEYLQSSTEPSVCEASEASCVSEPTLQPAVDTVERASDSEPLVSGLEIGKVKINTRFRKYLYRGIISNGVHTLPSGTRYIMTEKGYRKVKS